jgi:GGDEF domain-containing protein
MIIMNRKAPSDTALLYRSLEEQAGHHPVRAIRLTGKGAEPLGLLLIGNTVSEAEVTSALAGLRFPDQPRLAAPGQAEEELPDLAWLRQQLAVEMDRVQQSKLPCALLLITLSGGNTLAEQAAAALAPYLHPGDLLSGFQKNGLALIMPGAAVGKARRRAEEIRAALRNGAFTKGTTAVTPNLALGIAVCHAYETMPADQFLALAEAELTRAAKMGNDAICQRAAAHAEDSCQVTVEERAQLWMQPRKPSRAAGMAAQF